MKQITYLTIIIMICSCCGRNKLKTNEQKLKHQIVEEENEQKEAISESSIVTRNKPSLLLRLAEDRSSDPNKPPVIFDIVTARKKVKPFKYSQMGSRVRYVLLRHPKDSLFFDGGAQIKIGSKHIIAKKTWRGIASFDMNGQFIETVCSDYSSGLTDNEALKYAIRAKDMDNYKGSWLNFEVVGDNVFYAYVDRVNKTKQLICYNTNDNNLLPFNYFDPEKNTAKKKGEVMANLPFKGARNRLMVDERHFISTTRKMKSAESGVAMVMYSTLGDTVCTLKDHDPLTNVTTSVLRNPDGGDTWQLNGQASFRLAYNDTVYRVEGLNRFVPRFIVDYGNKGLGGTNNGMKPNIGLHDKFVPYSIIETTDYFFITYTQDYNCPATAQSGSLKYNKFIYNKKTGDSYHAYVDGKPHIPELPKNYNGPPMAWPSAPLTEGLINDIDASPARWPNKLTTGGKVFHAFTIKDIRKHIASKSFNASLPNADKLRRIVSNARETDLVIIIIE